jgi:hypothetical protein
LASAFAVWAIWWFYEAFVKIQDWDRIPMFHDRYVTKLDDDPYELEKLGVDE